MTRCKQTATPLTQQQMLNVTERYHHRDVIRRTW